MIAANIEKIRQQLPGHVKLIAVSKTYPVESLLEAYAAGQRAFGENKVQEMIAKQPHLPADTEWHLIGHLQTNKVKYIAPFVHLIHSVDSLKLLEVIDKEAGKNNRVIDVLLQVHIASEETKFGLSEQEVLNILSRPFPHIRICGLMGMATNTDSKEQVQREFAALHALFSQLRQSGLPAADPGVFTILSMGMSSDYEIAIACGSNMVRIGSRIFGLRTH